MNTTQMSDTDTIQTWVRLENIRASGELGAVKTTTTEVIDFGRRIVESHVKGTVEGTPVNNRSTWEIDAAATPERAAAYRRRNGYVRVA